MSQLASLQTETVDTLIGALEPMIRRIVREEFSELLNSQSPHFLLSPEMPLYEDMLDILQKKQQGETKLYSYDEVWGE